MKIFTFFISLFFILMCTVCCSGQAILQWATYYGGTGTDQGYSLATDALGNVYMAGETQSPVGIATGGFQNTFGGGTDAFLVKFDASGVRQWATYYGGAGTDQGFSIAADPTSGDVYLAGRTSSAAGIASGGFQNTLGGGDDVFLAKFNSAGVRLWATYYGGTGNEDFGTFIGNSVAIDPINRDVYMVGQTASATGIASGGFQNTYAGGPPFGDAFIVKFNSAGNRLWATYYGGTGWDKGKSVATDAAGNVYLAGETATTTGIVSGGFQDVFGGGTWDAFLAKFNSAGSLQWSTYYGGPGADEGYSVATDASGSGDVYLSGQTNSATGIASGGFQNAYGGGVIDDFLVKFNSAGVRQWATYYGGVLADEWATCATDSCGNVYLAGDTYSSTGIASGGFQNTFNALEDFFVATFDAAGRLQCATYYGTAGSDNEGGYVTVDGSGNVYIAGSTPNAGMASGGYQNTVGGAYDACLVKFKSCAVTCIPLSVIASSNNTMCSGSSTGSATANVSGGNQPYNYLWSYAGQITQTITGLVAGTYTVVVTDASNATATATVTITEPSALTIALTSVSLTCNGINSGVITASVSGGTLPYIYSWNNSQTTSILSQLASSIYSVTVTDSNDCMSTNALTISQPAPITVSLTSTDANCGQADGSVSANASGGTGTFSYSWSNGGVTSQISNLASQIYSVTVTDSNNCITTGSVSISNLNGVTVQIISATSVTCNGACSGSAIAGGSGGGTPYIFLWSNGKTTATINNLCLGVYSVTVTDSNGCTTVGTTNIDEPTAIVLTTTTTPSHCNQSDGFASVKASGGTGAYTYLWSNGGSIAHSSNLIAQIYSVTVTDSNGCKKTTSTTVINLAGVTAQIISSTSVTCNGACDGLAIASGSGGSTPYIFLWSNNKTTTTINNLCFGIYSVTVTDNNGCVSTVAVTISQPAAITLTFTSVDAGCGQANGSISASASGGTGAFIYAWSNSQTTANLTHIAASIYSVTVTDSNSCTKTGSVTIFTLNTLTITVSGSTTIQNGQSTPLSASGGIYFQWYPATGLNCDTCQSPIASPSATTIYCVTVTDINGCSDNACVTINVEIKCEELFIPTAFSPNSDNNNDCFRIYGNTGCFKKFRLAVYDRWGEKVFTTNDPEECWDGTSTSLNANKKLCTGIFVYYLNATFGDKEINKQGNISLVR